VTMYDAFISYSHAGDGRLAPRLQSGLQRFAKPWWRLRGLRVFRDETGLSASPHLWQSIVDALDASSWFVLLASPESAASEWVGKEIEYWLEHRDRERMLVVITDGMFRWDQLTQSIDVDASTAIHPVLIAALSSEPRHIDMSWARAEEHLDRRHGRFQDALAELVAPIRGVPKDDIAGEDVRLHRRAIRAARLGVATLALLAIGATTAGTIAINQRSRAEAEALTASARSAAAYAISEADRNLDRSLLLGAAAASLEWSPATSYGLLTALEAAHNVSGFGPALGPTDGLSADGERVVSVTADGTVRVMTYPGLELVVERLLPECSDGCVVMYGDDGELIEVQVGVNERTGGAAGWADELVLLDGASLDTVSGPIPLGDTFDPSTGAGGWSVYDVSNDGSLIAIAPPDSTSITVLETASLDPVLTASVDTENCSETWWGPGLVKSLDVHVSDTHRRLLYTCESGVGMIDVDTGVLIATFDEPMDFAGSVSGGRFDRSGSTVEFGYEKGTVGGGTSIHDAETLEEVVFLSPGGQVLSADVDPVHGGEILLSRRDGIARYLVVPNLDNSKLDIELCDEGSERCPWDSDPGPYLKAGQPPLAAYLSEPVVTLATDDQLEFSAASSTARASFGTIRLAAADTGPTWSIAEVSRENPGRVVTGSPNGVLNPRRAELYKVGAVPRTWSVLSVETGATRTLDVGEPLFPTQVSPDGDMILAVDPYPMKSALYVLDAVDGRELRRINLRDVFPADKDDESWLYLGPVSPDGTKVILEAGVDGESELQIWDLATGDFVGRAFDTFQSFSMVAWVPSSDGLVMVAGDSLLELVDLDLNVVRSVPLGRSSFIAGIETAAALGGVAVAFEHGEVVLLATPSLEPIGAPFRTSGEKIHAGVVSPDGSLVVTYDWSRRLHIWSVADRSLLGPPMVVMPGDENAGLPLTLQFDAQGRLLVDSGAGTVLLSFAPEDLIAKACEIAGRELTAEEWSTYVGAQAQRPCGD
jgi:WD40 repeat protein